MFNVKQLKTKKIIKHVWKLIISTPNGTLEVPSLRPFTEFVRVCPLSYCYILM